MTTIVYLREVDAGTSNACWVVAAKGDPGAIPFQAVPLGSQRGLVAPTVTMVGDKLIAEGFKYLNNGEVVSVNVDSDGEMFINCCSGADDPANNRRLARFYLKRRVSLASLGLRRVL